MSEKNGGYRKPKNPAAVSGPGASSRRTDGRPSEDNMKQAKRYVTGMGYGENKELNEIQSQADLAGASTPQNIPAEPTPAPAQRMRLSELSALDAPSARPDEPITAGAAFGPGPGPEVIAGTPEYQMNQDERQQLLVLYGIVNRASSRDTASQSVKELARKLRSLL